ncbi:MAG: hypothetical protein F6K10_21760, partial [Moorea sp. SIO2B7]|nr:hypothetical protein [Moorena sp. SIO2B7]
MIRLSVVFILVAGFGIWSWLVMSDPSSPEQATAQIKLLEAVYENGNYLEAGIWGIFALVFAVNGVKATNIGQKRRGFIAAIVFLLFGLSDIVEVQTGAWWHPWWLFIWKIICVISM